MALLLRYEGQLSRLFDRTLNELQQLKKQERNEPQPAVEVEQNEPELVFETPLGQAKITPTNPTPPSDRYQEAAKAA